jgi:hypothetical protein
LSDRGYIFQCSIIGTGHLLQSLQARIDKAGLQGCVMLLGAKNQQEIRSLYSQSDIFVLACVVAVSGDRDGMPNVLLEAMAMQLPVITTPVTGNPELVQNEWNGLLVPEHDAQALALVMERLINDESPRSTRRNGRKTVIDSYDIHKQVTSLLNIFQQLSFTMITNVVATATRAKGPFSLYKRTMTIARRYGISSEKIDRALQRFTEVINKYECGVTFPITAITLDRHIGSITTYLDHNIEFAVHGYLHVDYSRFTPEIQYSHLSPASEFFTSRNKSSRFPFSIFIYQQHLEKSNQ